MFAFFFAESDRYKYIHLHKFLGYFFHTHSYVICTYVLSMFRAHRISPFFSGRLFRRRILQTEQGGSRGGTDSDQEAVIKTPVDAGNMVEIWGKYGLRFATCDYN